MRVMCIKNGLWLSEQVGLNPFGPSFGEIVTVTEVDGDKYYLKEWPTNSKGRIANWHSKNFVPLSTIDETELLEQREAISVNTF